MSIANLVGEFLFINLLESLINWHSFALILVPTYLMTSFDLPIIVFLYCKFIIIESNVNIDFLFFSITCRKL